MNSVLTRSEHFSRFLSIWDSSLTLPNVRYLSQEVVALGFVLDSVTMHISMQPEKVQQITLVAREMLGKGNLTARDIARLLRLFVSCFRATPLGKLHYRHLEVCKLKALGKNNWNFNAPAVLSQAAKCDIHWWLHTLPHTWAPIKRGPPSVTIFCDACTYGYGGVCNGLMTQGHFCGTEKLQSINTKECLAVYYSVWAFVNECRGHHILVRSDSSTTVANVSHMRSKSSPIRNKIMKDLWEFVYSIDAWITMRHLAGI